jgi:hypothetical protein
MSAKMNQNKRNNFTAGLDKVGGFIEAQGCVFSAGSSARSVARSGQESIAQGLPWVSQNKRLP